MFSFDKKDFQRFAVSTVGALAISTACVVAAVGPARAAVPAPLTVADWQGSVEKQIDTRMRGASTVLPEMAARNDAVVTVHFTPDGDYAGATLAQSSGVGLYDQHALHVAKHIAYPTLPAGLRGTAQDVEMRLSYDDKAPVNARPAQLALLTAPAAIQVASK